MIIKYFYEFSDDEYPNYNQIWNSNRILIIDPDIGTKQDIFEQLKPEKDILGFRFPSSNIINNYLVQELIKTQTIKYKNQIWKPSQIWIYSTII